MCDIPMAEPFIEACFAAHAALSATLAHRRCRCVMAACDELARACRFRMRMQSIAETKSLVRSILIHGYAVDSHMNLAVGGVPYGVAVRAAEALRSVLDPPRAHPTETCRPEADEPR